MGQTLTHGVYLPDEGERNCYSGLASNWSLLDGAVGTIAEHTTALAGKAPAVHTHTVSQITDFPAYGTTAGTICEGNDSRLSDARTPVAHTHTKSDVTDLFNSANTWSGEQTFSQTIQGNVATASEFASNQSVTLTGTIEGTASSKAGWTIATDFREGRGARTTTDFYAKLASGSVSGGWNVYVATFICNASERFETALIQICFVLNQQGIVDATNGVQLRIRSIHGLPQSRFVLVWKNDTNKVLFELYAYNPSANQGVLAQLLNEFIRNGNKQSINIQMHSNVVVNALPDGYTVVNAETALTANNFIPSANNSYDLGSSSYQWNNLYAKNYYYNGVAWGLDKENVWGGSNRFTKSINLGNITSYTDCTLGFTGLYNTLFFNTRGSTNITSYGTYVYYGYSNASSDRGSVIRMVRTTDKRGDANDGYIPDLSFNLYKISPAKLFIDFMEAVRVINDGTENSLKPITNNVTDLGTSDNKWKSINGINPGALSLPSGGTTENTDWFNVAGDILPTGGNATSFSRATANYFIPAKDGWLALAVKNCSELSVWCETLKYGISIVAPDASVNRQTVIPVVAGKSYQILITGNNWISARLIMPRGNV